MTQERVIYLAAALLVIVAGVLAGSGVPAHLVAMAGLAIGGAYLYGWFVKRDADRDWLPRLLAWGMVAKLAGSWVRHAVLFGVYEGTGDAVQYHDRGLQLADIWRTLTVPEMATAGGGSEGTQFISWLTGLLYAPYEPSTLGGFWIYAQLAFAGQVFLYLAFRRFAPDGAWKRYALLIFFWPTLLYWPSSIGKEAVLLLFLGVGSWAASGLYRGYHLRWLPALAAPVALIAIVRVHVAALFAGSVVAGILLAKKDWSPGAITRLMVIVSAGALAAIPILSGISQEFGVDLASAVNTDDLDPVIADIERRTGQGGSAINAQAVRSPADLPEAGLRVIFRPLPNEADSMQTMAASLEGLLLLGVVVWRGRDLLRNLRLLRRYPYVMFCLVYILGFIYGWSAILNYGILARQRSLMIPYFLAVIALLGWRDDEPPEPSGHDDESRPSQEVRAPVPAGVQGPV